MATSIQCCCGRCVPLFYNACYNTKTVRGRSGVTKTTGRDVRVVASNNTITCWTAAALSNAPSFVQRFFFYKCFGYRACAAVPISTAATPQESAWELPPSAREVAPQDTTAAAATALVPVQDVSSCWTRVLDDSTNTSYFFNTSTQVHACLGATEPSLGVLYECVLCVG